MHCTGGEVVSNNRCWRGIEAIVVVIAASAQLLSPIHFTVVAMQLLSWTHDLWLPSAKLSLSLVPWCCQCMAVIIVVVLH